MARYNGNTPRRKLSLCSSGTPTPVAALKSRLFDSQLSIDDGCCMDSPSPVDTDSSFSLASSGQADSGERSIRSGQRDSCQRSIAKSGQADSGGRSIDNSEEEDSCEKSTDKCPSYSIGRFKGLPPPFPGFDPSPSSTESVSRLGDGEDSCCSPSFQNYSSPALAYAPRRRSPLKPLLIGTNSNSDNQISPCKSSEDDETSQDSGVCFDRTDSKDSAFKFPIAPAPRSARLSGDESSSPFRYSPAHKNAPKNFKGVAKHFTGSLFNESPLKHQESTATSDSDDGINIDLHRYYTDNVQEGVPHTKYAPAITTLGSLFNSTIPNTGARRTNDDSTPKLASRIAQENQGEDQENSKPTRFRRGLFRSPSAPRLLPHESQGSPLSSSPVLSYKRARSKRSPPRCCTNQTRITKRRKSVLDKESNTWAAPIRTSEFNVSPPSLHRAHSSEAIIKKALQRQESCPNLVGDMSRTYGLPLCNSKHNDLKAIEPSTMTELLNGVYDDAIEKYIVLDCRYPYEFDAGHIKGAKNLYTKEQILDEFFNKEHKATEDTKKRTVLVFHCEFSSERAPKMSRFLRSHDRTKNKELYPFLNYPEIYLLEGGYKRFYEETDQSHCVPKHYKQMLHEDHADDLKHFRLKTKSWNGDEREGRFGPRPSFRGLKF